MSNIVSIINGELLTTSLSIAEGTDNQHKNVISLIRGYQEDLEEFGQVAFETRSGDLRPQGGTGRPTEYALLNQHQATLLLTYMKNSLIIRRFKKALVKAFFEMEARSGFKLPKTFAEAMRLAADQAEEALRLEGENKVLKPKAEFHDKVVISEDAIPVAEAAKVIGTGRNRLLAFLRRSKWVTRKNEPYQSKIESGLMDVKLSPFEHPTQRTQA